MSYVAVYSQVVIAIVFTAAAISKLSAREDFREFVRSLRRLRSVPRRAAAPAGWALLIGEAITAPLMALSPSAGRALAVFLLAALTVGATLIVRSNAVVACRCFGAATEPLSRRHVARNVFLLTIATSGIMSDGISPTASPAATAAAVASGLLTALVVIRLDDIVYLFRSSP
ncbi:MauE/DoxX family redox-associated membrane protein [Streptomyces sp. SID13031]|uniref:MauE/DoxX family redox-associated membrane protein n=1 Tax=Streptomyces sp. SID13031 TaxID=2706046 RepID=UPI0013CACB5C|nr:MauE/DoxX family redox-associated membrane protein [Streptomyces sp. SID13031]NEA34323.1 hypothetical protein [Streptomyces sp. SID13031]